MNHLPPDVSRPLAQHGTLRARTLAQVADWLSDAERVVPVVMAVDWELGELLDGRED